MNTCYLCDFNLYTGQGGDDNHGEFNDTTAAVLVLTTGLENEGHIIYMDNFYIYPRLAVAVEGSGEQTLSEPAGSTVLAFHQN